MSETSCISVYLYAISSPTLAFLGLKQHVCTALASKSQTLAQDWKTIGWDTIKYWPERKPRTKISLGLSWVTTISRKKMEKDQAVSFLIPMRGYAYPRLHAAHFVNCFTGILMIMICYGNLFHHVIIQVHHEMPSQNVFKRGFWIKDFVSQIPGTHVHQATTIWSKYHWRIVKVICCFLYSDYFPVWLKWNMSLDGCWIARFLTSRLDLWKTSDVGWSWWKREVPLFLLTFALWLLDVRGRKEHPQYLSILLP